MTLIYSQQVDWWTVHEYVAPVLDRVVNWPLAGSVEWQNLRDDDVCKIAAVCDAARHHILRVDTAQNAMCQAGESISAAEDWAAVARVIYNRACFEAERPWLKRGAA
jgi:hypothetical protein